MMPHHGHISVARAIQAAGEQQEDTMPSVRICCVAGKHTNEGPCMSEAIACSCHAVRDTVLCHHTVYLD